MFYVRCLQRGIFLPQAVKQQQNAEVDLTQQKRIRKLEPVVLFSSPKFDRKGFLFSSAGMPFYYFISNLLLPIDEVPFPCYNALT